MNYRVIDKETYYRKGVFRLLEKEMAAFAMVKRKVSRLLCRKDFNEGRDSHVSKS